MYPAMMKIQLPEEIISSEILARLPVKSLMRFKCVSKSWYALFQNPCFINAHRVFHNNTRRLLVNGVVKLGEDRVLSIFSDEIQLKSYLDAPFPFPIADDEDAMKYGVHLVGLCSINGIICLLLNFSTVIIMNPATRESKVIRRSYPCSDTITYYQGYGFGYDLLTDDYKLIRFVWSSCNYRHLPLSQYQFVEVYCLRSDCWRKLDPAISWYIRPGHCGNIVFVNGMNHWTAFDGLSLHKKEILVSFDMSTELFYTTILPYQRGVKQLARFKESISMMDVRFLQLGICLDVWILGEVGANDSWTRHLTVGPLLHIRKPIGAGENGEIFFLKDVYLQNDDTRVVPTMEEAELACYDPNTQMLRNLGLTISISGWTSAVVIYSETIVSLQRNN